MAFASRALVLAALSLSPHAQAEVEDVEVKSASLQLEVDPALVDVAARRKLWDAACASLAKALSEGGGAWGMGIFSETRCDAAAPDFGRGPGGSLWRLKVARAGDDGELRLDLGRDGQEAAATLTVGRALHPLELLARPELARRVAALLLDELPMIWRLKALTPVKGKPAVLVLRHPALTHEGLGDSAKIPPPPKKLNVYGLRWDERAKLWRPRIVGTARRSRVVAPKRGPSGVGRATYAVDQSVAKALAMGPLWAHDAQGAGANAQVLGESFRDAYEELAAAQEERLASPLVASASDLLGLVGMRYGVPLLAGNPLLERTSFFGLVVEMRVGPLSGLQYYYDVLPSTSYAERTSNDLTAESSIEWSRHVLGFTFGLPFPWLIERVTLTPKLGVWNLRATIPGVTDAEGRVSELREFAIDKAISLGAEAGAELRVKRAAFRPWLGVDSGYSPFGAAKRVTSRRVGLDLYVAGPAIGGVRMALLGFLFVENVSLTTDAPPTGAGELDADGVSRTTARRIDFVAGYGGGGLALSW